MKSKKSPLDYAGTWIGAGIFYILRLLSVNVITKIYNPTLQFKILKTFGINAGWGKTLDYPIAYWITWSDILLTILFIAIGFTIGYIIHKGMSKR